jgi:hypothetical protein
MENKKDLYEYQLNGKERDDGLNLADYDALVKKARNYSKQELEDYYIDRKNSKDNNYTGWGLVAILAAMFFFIALGYAAGTNTVYEQSHYAIEKQSQELCKYLPDNFASGRLVEGGYFAKYKTDELRIVCVSSEVTK